MRVNSLNLSVKDNSDTDSSIGSDVRISLTFDTTSCTDGTGSSTSAGSSSTGSSSISKRTVL